MDKFIYIQTTKIKTKSYYINNLNRPITNKDIEAIIEVF